MTIRVKDFGTLGTAELLFDEDARKRHKAQLFGLAQLLFEAGVIDSPPRRHYPAAATLEQRFAAALPDTPIRTAMIRYVTARQTMLAASSADGLVNDLIPFGVFLTEHHPDIALLRQLERLHIEGFLAFNRTRTWRGRKARGQQVSMTVVHAAMLSLRNFLDDITLWGHQLGALELGVTLLEVGLPLVGREQLGRGHLAVVGDQRPHPIGPLQTIKVVPTGANSNCHNHSFRVNERL